MSTTLTVIAIQRPSFHEIAWEVIMDQRDWSIIDHGLYSLDLSLSHSKASLRLEFDYGSEQLVDHRL